MARRLLRAGVLFRLFHARGRARIERTEVIGRANVKSSRCSKSERPFIRIQERKATRDRRMTLQGTT